jgi:hypothetical protein
MLKKKIISLVSIEKLMLIANFFYLIDLMYEALKLEFVYVNVVGWNKRYELCQYFDNSKT